VCTVDTEKGLQNDRTFCTGDHRMQKGIVKYNCTKDHNSTDLMGNDGSCTVKSIAFSYVMMT
jgi:hypothetical protein